MPHGLAVEDAGALTEPSCRALPLTPRQAESLVDALSSVPDPRARNRRHAAGPMLASLVLAALCGRTGLNAMFRFAQALTQEQKRLLCFRSHPRHPGLRKAPSYKAYWSPEEHRPRRDWGPSTAGSSPRPAPPPRWPMTARWSATSPAPERLRHRHLMTVACVPIRKKGGEIPAAREALAGIPGGLSGATVSGDAAHCQKETARQIVDGGGEYLLQAKANQKKLLAKARALEGLAPFLTST